LLQPQAAGLFPEGWSRGFLREDRVGYLKKQVTTEINDVEWLQKEPLSMKFEMGIGHILVDWKMWSYSDGFSRCPMTGLRI